MDVGYLEKSRERMPNVPLLINVVSKRVRQLNSGARPLVRPDSPQVSNMDIALRELAENKLTAEMGFAAANPLKDNLLAD